MSQKYVIGVDVGTGSARAGIFDCNGQMLAQQVQAIQTWKPQPEHVEQSSDDIWQAVCSCVAGCRETSGIRAEDVVGIAFDATCSLVVLDKQFQPLAVNREGDNARNIIVWMDHRALQETAQINAGDHQVLKYVGGQSSPEMETPKLLWLKNNLPETYHNAAKFFDLADFLTWRASGQDVRSLCTLVCKWTYLGHEKRWDEPYFRAIGLDDLLDGTKIGDDVRAMGEDVGPLNETSAQELGLTVNCRVGMGIIDAHAGGLGVLGAVWNTDAPSHSSASTCNDENAAPTPDLARLETVLALIGGTSNCHMAVSLEPKFVPGVWGPYFGAMVPQMWLCEGGQSTAGSAIDYVIQNHSFARKLNEQAERENRTVYEILNAEIARLQTQSGCGPQITRDWHVLPYFLGNRSPNADPHARALIEGMRLDDSLSDLALRYYATLQAIAYGTRDIVRALNENGFAIDTLFVTGGGTKNPLWLQEHADATGCTLVLPSQSEAVLLGSAVLAATAAQMHRDIYTAMAQMNRAGEIIAPRIETRAYHDAKFAIFREMYQQQLSRREQMKAF